MHSAEAGPSSSGAGPSGLAHEIVSDEDDEAQSLALARQLQEQDDEVARRLQEEEDAAYAARLMAEQPPPPARARVDDSEPFGEPDAPAHRPAKPNQPPARPLPSEPEPFGEPDLPAPRLKPSTGSRVESAARIAAYTPAAILGGSVGVAGAAAVAPVPGFSLAFFSLRGDARYHPGPCRLSW